MKIILDCSSMILILVCILLMYVYFSPTNIIGYMHVCQKDKWTKSYDMLMSSIKKYGLYDKMKELRIGVVNDSGVLIPDERLNDPKIKIIYVGTNVEYERPTLLHMKHSKDGDDTMYFYLHTKGIRHFGTKNEDAVLKWINDLLYWNIQLWRNAVFKLSKYETYGCNYKNIHYSGNFWWATKKHINKLPSTIPDYYTAPEDWILVNKDNMYCVNNCGKQFKRPYPKDFY